MNIQHAPTEIEAAPIRLHASLYSENSRALFIGKKRESNH